MMMIMIFSNFSNCNVDGCGLQNMLVVSAVVNLWYDMAYDIRYSYYKFVESLLSARQSVSSGRDCSAANYAADVGQQSTVD